MSYTIESIEFYVRETGPARFASALGKAALSDQQPERVTSPLCHVRMAIKDSEGNETFGCAADRLSVRWLDKRPQRSKALKLRELAALLEQARETYLASATFDSPFAQWRACYEKIAEQGRRAGQEDLTSAFASALLERAMLDGVSRLAGKPLFQMLREDRLDLQPARIHQELGDLRPRDYLPARPRTQINIRHTIGVFDPLTSEDWPEEKRLNDGLPETIEDYIRRDGVRFFKVKISGDADADLARLARIWEILPLEAEPALTLDANEAYEDLEQFARFVERLENEQLGLFQHILFIEQPLPRRLALNQRAAKWIQRVGRIKPVIIDESDAFVDAFKQARGLGYAGTSHKNCKGFFKSLLNKALAAHYSRNGQPAVLSAEDLQNLPIVPLHQDFVSVGILDIEHCERNGHHYNFGLSMLSERDKASIARHHRDLYSRRGGEWFLRVENGVIDCASLHCPGFGVADEPDWASMETLQAWLKRRHAG